jgi:hypothetical protein
MVGVAPAGVQRRGHGDDGALAREVAQPLEPALADGLVGDARDVGARDGDEPVRAVEVAERDEELDGPPLGLALLAREDALLLAREVRGRAPWSTGSPIVRP